MEVGQSENRTPLSLLCVCSQKGMCERRATDERRGAAGFWPPGTKEVCEILVLELVVVHLRTQGADAESFELPKIERGSRRGPRRRVRGVCRVCKVHRIGASRNLGVRRSAAGVTDGGCAVGVRRSAVIQSVGEVGRVRSEGGKRHERADP